FKLARDPDAMGTVGDILYRSAEAIRIACCLLEPVMPSRMASLRESWNLGEATRDTRDECRWGRLENGTVIDKVALFPRVDLTQPEA
ncbi:MAG TPA: methionine--tRNA ligase, partial [Phycisphaerales bacterium]|nr:methionine--tRNA ligase [Phycisphaerales bacterium]